MLFIFGVGKMLPSVSIMIRAMALPISALFSQWSFLHINKKWTCKQVFALSGILAGVVWILFASRSLQKEWFSQE